MFSVVLLLLINNLEYGDINNPDWVHVSYVNENKNRKEVLKCIRDKKGNPKYIPYKK